jgi:coenzyme F420-reducing hydrogenase gamma subunit
MSFNEILEEIPKLSHDEKKQLQNLLAHALEEEKDEAPEILAAIDEGLRSLANRELRHTLAEARERVKTIVARARR